MTALKILCLVTSLPLFVNSAGAFSGAAPGPRDSSDLLRRMLTPNQSSEIQVELGSSSSSEFDHVQRRSKEATLLLAPVLEDSAEILAELTLSMENAFDLIDRYRDRLEVALGRRAVIGDADRDIVRVRPLRFARRPGEDAADRVDQSPGR